MISQSHKELIASYDSDSSNQKDTIQLLAETEAIEKTYIYQYFNV